MARLTVEIVTEKNLPELYDKIEQRGAGVIAAHCDRIGAYLAYKNYPVLKISGSHVLPTHEGEAAAESFLVVNSSGSEGDPASLERHLRRLAEHFGGDSVLILAPDGAHVIGTSRREDARPTFGQRVPVGAEPESAAAAAQLVERINRRGFAFADVKHWELPGTITGRWGWYVATRDLDRQMAESLPTASA